MPRRRVVLSLGAALPGLWLLAGCADSTTQLLPANLARGVLCLASAQGDRLVFITSQWEQHLVYPGGQRFSSAQRGLKNLNIDFWLIDATTAQPLRRVRLVKAKQLGDVAVLGADRGVLWLRLPELMGVRLTDGAVVADRARIAAANPALASLLPMPPAAGTFFTEEQQRLRFNTSDGLVMLLDDGHQVRVDALTFKAQRLSAAERSEAAPRVPDPQRPAVRRLATGMQWDAMVRGVPIARSEGGAKPAREQEWLGLVSERELAQVAREGSRLPPTTDFSHPERFKLYRGRLRSERTFMGERVRLELLQPLPEAPEFLFAGLGVDDAAANPGTARSALWRRGPDSVFVLHRDRLGDQGRWLLSRIAGPAGRELWRVALPLSGVELWWPRERHVLMMGTWLHAQRSPMAEERDGAPLQIVSVDLDSGAMAVFNLDTERGWPLTLLTFKAPG